MPTSCWDFRSRPRVQFGDNNYHFRGNSWDLFVQDEWRVRGNLTLNLGVRYEYVLAFTESNDRIVNLDVAPWALPSPAASRCRSGETGPYNGQLPGNAGSSRPQQFRAAPRHGLEAAANTVVRAGYGINYNTSAYQSIVQNMAFQPPFSTTPPTLNRRRATDSAEWISAGALPVSITNNYGVDPNYRLGYVQIWNLDIQREILPR